MGISFADMPRLLLTVAVRWMPTERGEWGMAMLAELAQLQHPSTRWRFALGCASAALLAPRQGGLLQAIMNNNTKSVGATLRMSAIIGFLITLPFMLLDFLFVKVKNLNTFSLRNALDSIVLFGFLWLALAAIVFILTPVARAIRAGNNPNPALTQGNAPKNIGANPGSAAIIGFILALPFMTFVSMLMLNIEPPSVIEELVGNSDPDKPDILGSLILLGSFLLSVLACIVVRAPIARALRAGKSLLAHPVNLAFSVVILFFIVSSVVGVIIDQFPCWIGVPNCD